MVRSRAPPLKMYGVVDTVTAFALKTCLSDERPNVLACWILRRGGRVTLSETFRNAAQRRELVLIAYLTAGYPTRAAFLEHLRAVEQAGADVIEIGVPFSDPMADGPTIQQTSQEALRGGARLCDILADLRDTPAARPRVLMSYLNPLLALEDRLAPALREARIEALVVPDLPLEEADAWQTTLKAASVALVFLAAPTSSEERLRAIGQRSESFVYAVTVTGITGARRELPAELPQFLARLRAACSRPVAVGFGISDAAHIRGLHGMADGVVVGSRLMQAIGAGEDLAALVQTLKSATREAREPGN